MDNRPSLGARLFTATSVIGDVLLLQLYWLVVSLGVVTIVPASVALQRSLDDVLAEGRMDTSRVFFSRFVVALQRFWLIGVLAPILVGMYVIAVLFWTSASGFSRIAALAFLLPLGGLAFSAYLATLSVTPRLSPNAGVRETASGGWDALASSPLAAAGCLVLMVTWLLLLSKLPSLSLIGLGLVPAFLALWLARVPERQNPARSPDR